MCVIDRWNAYISDASLQRTSSVKRTCGYTITLLVFLGHSHLSPISSSWILRGPMESPHVRFCCVCFHQTLTPSFRRQQSSGPEQAVGWSVWVLSPWRVLERNILRACTSNPRWVIKMERTIVGRVWMVSWSIGKDSGSWMTYGIFTPHSSRYWGASTGSFHDQ